MKSKFIKVLIACLIICALGAGGYYGYKKYVGSKPSAAAQAYMTVTARKMNLSVGVQGTGTAYAAVSKNVVSNNSGILSGLSVNVGDSVKAGQQLFTANNEQLRQQSDKAQNDLAKQKIQLSNAKTDNDVQTQTLALNDAQESADYASEQVNKMTVTSPINGIVTTESNANGDNVQGGAAILTVVDPSSMKIKVAVDELDIDKVKVGQKAAITFDAIKDKAFDGTVESISPVGTSTNNVTTYDVVVSVNNPDGVKLGMNANVNIEVASKSDALVVPAEALIERNGNKYVMVPNSTSNTQNGNTGSNSGGNQNTGNNQQSGGQKSQYGNMRNSYSGQGKLVQIQTGIENENYIEVTEGLTEGQKLLVQLPQVNSTTNSRSGLGGFGGGLGGFGGSMGGGFSGGNGGNRNQSSKSSQKSN